MTRSRTHDQPICDPNSDLLGTSDWAQEMASFVEGVPWPLTLGVYGEWGEGKTSFVKLVYHYLQSMHGKSGEFELLEFSAWPYTTSDAAWRALGRKLAALLCGVPYGTPGSNEADEPSGQKVEEEGGAEQRATNTESAKKRSVQKEPAQQGLLPALHRALFREAFVIHEPALEKRQRDYEAVAAALDASATVVMNRRAAGGGDGTNLAAIAGFLAQAGSSFVPWLSVMKNAISGSFPDEFSGSGGSGSVSVLESVDQTRSLFKRLFDEYGRDSAQRDRRIVLFVDDLDRCMPEVALEVLEALKIFLDEAPCLFVIAADESLIGKGLRARYLRALGSELEADERRALKKGREYFEKMIQLGFCLPKRNPEEIHSFISSQFPAWGCASDLLRVLTGSNPRRLVQMCNLLSYHFSVASKHFNPDRYGADLLSQEVTSVLEKLIRCHAVCSEFIEPFNKKLESAENPSLFLIGLEDQARDLVQETEKDRLSLAESENEILTILVDNRRLCTALLESPLFSKSDVELLSDLTLMADLRALPSEEHWWSRDRVLLRFLQDIPKVGGLHTAEYVLQQDLERILELDMAFHEVTEFMFAHADESRLTWHSTLHGIERWLAGETSSKPLEEESSAIFEAVRKIIQGGKEGEEDQRNQPVRESQEGQEDQESHADLQERGDEIRRIFTASPSFSSILPQTFLAYSEISLHNDLWGQVKDDSAATQKARQRNVAHEVAESMPDELLEKLRLRQRAAVFFWEHRKSVKMEGLNREWPRLAAQFRFEMNGPLRDLERLAFAEPTADNPWPPPPWQSLQGDERLRQFLRLPPFLGEMDRSGLQQVVETVDLHSLASGLEEAELATVVPEPMPTPVRPAAVPPVQESYEELVISIVEGADPRKSVLLMSCPGTGSKVETSLDELSFGKVQEINQKLSELYGVGAVVRHLKRVDPGGIHGELKRLGDRLYSIFFGGLDSREQKENDFLRTLGLERTDSEPLRGPVRLLVDTSTKWANVPWEILRLPEFDEFLALSKAHSLVRWTPRQKNLQPLAGTDTPLRVLAVLSSPRDLSRLDLEQEARILQSTLTKAGQAGKVVLEIRTAPTRSNIMSWLRTFRPHIFHFVGHGALVIDGEEKQGALALESDGGLAEMMEARRLKTLLTRSSIKLAVLNGCETGLSGATDTLTSVAGVLVENGIPAAVATIRPIDDRTALHFTQEFYRALTDGCPLELALVEARRALEIAQQNWSAYALFGSVDKLAALQFADHPPGGQRSEVGEANRIAAPKFSSKPEPRGDV